MTSALLFDILKWAVPTIVVITMWLARVEFVGRVNKEAIRLVQEASEKKLTDLEQAHEKLRDEMIVQRERTTRVEVRMDTVYQWMAEIKTYIERRTTE